MGGEQKKARILCLHGYENSGSILKKQLGMSGWLKELGTTCDFVFASAPFDSALPVTPIVQQYFPKDPKCQWFERIEHLDTGGVRYVGLNKVSPGPSAAAAAVASSPPCLGVLTHK